MVIRRCVAIVSRRGELFGARCSTAVGDESRIGLACGRAFDDEGKDGDIDNLIGGERVHHALPRHRGNSYAAQGCTNPDVDRECYPRPRDSGELGKDGLSVI